MTVVDDIKARLDIVDVVSSFVNLQKSGRNFRALCPFHPEKTPSFFVFPERQSWRCFGACATGGDLFSFVIKMENLEFAEALRRLAQQSGVSLPTPRQRPTDDTLHQVNEAARRFFCQLLASPEGIEARAYLERRGFTPETIERFQLGLSPRDGQALKSHLLAQGSTEAQLASAGVVTQREGGGWQDLLRGRLVFPLRDGEGRLVGFAGRALDDSQPKYLNSPQTPLFQKGHLLYGLHLARDGIKQRGAAVVVEGYTDVLMAHQYGYTHVVASMGTALTEHQVALLRGLAGTVVLALDPDAAGQEATLRSLESSWRVFQRRAVARVRGTTLYERPQVPTLKVALLPPGQDPDQLIHERTQEWERLLSEALLLEDYLFEVLPARMNLDLNTVEGKRELFHRLSPFISLAVDFVEQDHYLTRLAGLLGVSKQDLKAEMRRTPQAQPFRPTTRAPTSVFQKAQHDPLEEYCLALLFRYPDLAQLAGEMAPEYLLRPENRALFTEWTKCSTIEMLKERLDVVLSEHLSYLLQKSLPPADYTEREQAFGYCLRRLEERYLKEVKVEEELRLAQAPPEEQYLHEPESLEVNERLRRLFLQQVQ
ncbi:MAG: DNA primase [Dehalococcoidia bacterium]